MKKYFIYHPSDGDINVRLSLDGLKFRSVGFVRAASLEEALESAHRSNPAYAQLNIRSTAWGDIIVCDGQGYMITGVTAITPIPGKNIRLFDLNENNKVKLTFFNN